MVEPTSMDREYAVFYAALAVLVLTAIALPMSIIFLTKPAKKNESLAVPTVDSDTPYNPRS